MAWMVRNGRYMTIWNGALAARPVSRRRLGSQRADICLTSAVPRQAAGEAGALLARALPARRS